MKNPMKWFLLVFLAIDIASAATPDTNADDKCRLIFDAGSSGTRLYAYKLSNGDLKEVYADSAGIGIGVSWSLEKKQCGDTRCTDANIKKAVADLIREFHRAKTDYCKAGIATVNLLSTAGMRLASQKRGRAAIRETYSKLTAEVLKTFASLGDEYSSIAEDNISARTLTGQEEAIYTWLTVNTLKGNHERLEGIFEIGGASLQLAYPCGEGDQKCLGNAIKVKYKNTTVNLFGYSWLGLGRTEAFRIYNVERGFPCNSISDSKNNSVFDSAKCTASIATSFTENAQRDFVLLDPLNYNSAGIQGRAVIVSIPPGTEFHGVGAIAYENLNTLKADAAQICDRAEADLIAHREGAFDSIQYTPDHLLKSQCFARLYFDALLENIPGLKLSANDRKIDRVRVGWTLGAAICEQTDCLDKNNLSCRWIEDLSCSSTVAEYP
jgi:hypothetical protein